MRTLALWFPDWPVQALGKEVAGPVLVVGEHEVVCANGEARRLGATRGMRARAAQALLPQAEVVAASVDRDARVFAEVADCLDEVVSSVEILRPGVAAVNLGAALRFYGSEEKVAEKVIDAVARVGMDCFAGIADEVPTAVIAARGQQVVPAGRSREYLADVPLEVLGREPALRCEQQVVDTLASLGIATLGQLAELDERALLARFGHPGARCQAVARAADGTLPAPAIKLAELGVEVVPEEPVSRVDEAAFLSRSLAANLHAKIARLGVVCHRLKMVAQLGEKSVERVWSTSEELGEQAMADRVRWQLDAWLTAGNTGALTMLRVEAVEVSAPDTGVLWGVARDDATQRVLSRLQSTLGTDALLTPHEVGGRGVADRIALLPYGERIDVAHPGAWRGALRGPLPASIVHPAAACMLIDATGTPIEVTEEALLSGQPAGLSWGKRSFSVLAWAGPWPLDERWWRGGAPCARLQVVGEDGEGQHAWLLAWAGRWRVEASY